MRETQSRVTWFLGLIAFAILGMGAQMYRLTGPQSSEWQVLARDNMQREMERHGPRGVIYDRKGRALATSEPAFAAVLLRRDTQAVELFLPELAQLLAAGDTERAQGIMKRVRSDLKDEKKAHYEPITIATKLDKTVVSRFIERRQEFPGVTLFTDSARNYPNGKFAGALLGYVQPVSIEDLQGEFKDLDYRGDEIVGQDGLERFYEQHLRGKPGKQSITVDSGGRPVRDGQVVPPVPGNDLYLTLDQNLQRVAEEALTKQIAWIRQQNDREANPTRGALVMQDVRTGAILAMASVPTFDPNMFVVGLSEKQSNELFNDPVAPLLNWAIKAKEPGSTYKMGVGLAGLEAGVIGPYEQMECSPTYKREPKLKNWAPYHQGFADVARALALSCNPFFYEVGYRLNIDPLAEFLKQFGFGQRTGIDLVGEQSGSLPTQESYGDRWQPGNIFSVAIGQGDDRVTMLQLANYIATIAASGDRYRPFLLSEIRSPAGELIHKMEPQKLGTVKAKPENWQRIQEGMRQTAQTSDGTAYTSFLHFPIEVGGKTGSAETGQYWANGLAVAYAPYKNPEIAVSVFIEGGSKGSWAGPVARRVMAAYFGFEDKNKEGVPTYKD